ncbi:MAG: hypothetical protein QXV17_12690 [Candidatus Micrarchaeaceae archaeon]
MDYFALASLVYLIGITLFAGYVLNRLIQRIPDIVQNEIRNAIEDILNDKELYDEITRYLQGLAKGTMQSINPMPRSRGLLGDILPMILSRFIPIGPRSESPENPENQEKPQKKPEKPEKVINPFQKKSS